MPAYATENLSSKCCCIPLIFCHLIDDRFLSSLTVFSFEVNDDLVGVGQGKNTHNYMLCCTILMQFDLERKRSREKRTSKLIYPNRNGTVRVLVVNTYFGTCPYKEGGGGGKDGAGSEFSLLACDVSGKTVSIHCLTS